MQSELQVNGWLLILEDANKFDFTCYLRAAIHNRSNLSIGIWLEPNFTNFGSID
jgi:hypothetical protein